MRSDEKPHTVVSRLNANGTITLCGSGFPPIAFASHLFEPDALSFRIRKPQVKALFSFALNFWRQLREQDPKLVRTAGVHSGNLRPRPAFISARALAAIRSSGTLAFLRAAANCSSVNSSGCGLSGCGQVYILDLLANTPLPLVNLTVAGWELLPE